MQWEPVRPTKNQREALDRQEALWLAAVESGEHTTSSLARLLNLSPSWMRERLARARASRPESSSSTTPDGIPRLALIQGPNPRECSHSATSIGDSVIACLDCDATSIDGGESWIPPGPDTPKLTVLVPHGHGSRRERLEPRPWQAPPDPPGPTSYRPPDSLDGGKGGRKRRAKGRTTVGSTSGRT
jgi:hypothetical protein